MSVAERTRDAVRREPFLLDALGAGVVNYSAAARYLDVDGDEESIATALRRFATELDEPDPDRGRTSVRIHRGISLQGERPADPTAARLRVGETWLVDGGSLTAVVARGDLDASALEAVLARLRAADVDVAAAGATGEQLVVAVGQRAGADALRLVEDAL